MTDEALKPGDVATWLHYRRFRRQGLCYRPTVRVLDIRKHTARIEARRYDNTVVRRFVKLERLIPGARFSF